MTPGAMPALLAMEYEMPAEMMTGMKPSAVPPSVVSRSGSDIEELSASWEVPPNRLPTTMSMPAEATNGIRYDTAVIRCFFICRFFMAQPFERERG